MRSIRSLVLVTLLLVVCTSAPNAAVAGQGAKGSTVVAETPPPLDECETPFDIGKRWRWAGQDWICQCFALGDNGTQACGWVLEKKTPNPSTWINLNSGLRLVVQGGATGDRARLIQWPYNGAADQWWNGVPGARDGLLRVTNVKSGRCMGILDARTNESAPAIQFGCNGNPDQEWRWVFTGRVIGGLPAFRIINLNSRRCLGVLNASRAAGAAVILWSCNGNPDQAWY